MDSIPAAPDSARAGLPSGNLNEDTSWAMGNPGPPLTARTAASQSEHGAKALAASRVAGQVTRGGDAIIRVPGAADGQIEATSGMQATPANGRSQLL